ncbi:MAG: ornithine carbamoyltransferase [Rickettsiales bacterium]|nr:ornithine carbamoyltransferase [Rickettsiales bacterium]
MVKHFIDLDDISSSDLREIIELAKKLKKEYKDKGRAFRGHSELLAHKNLAMIFEKTSTRTRVSFDVGFNQLGGNAIVMNKTDMQLVKGESASDTAKALSRYVDGIMIRAISHDTIVDIAKYSDVPVINALSDFSHPCQIMASIMTIEETLGTSIEGKRLSWFGDANNVLNSYIHGAKKFSYELTMAVPTNSDLKEFDLCDVEIKKAQDSGAKVTVVNDPKEAAKDAEVVITDTWFSMGDETEHNDALRQKKINVLKPYQVNSDIMSLASDNAIFTHCLPAYREYEVTSEVIDSEASVVFDEVENRLHIQKAILLWTMGDK